MRAITQFVKFALYSLMTVVEHLLLMMLDIVKKAKSYFS